MSDALSGSAQLLATVIGGAMTLVGGFLGTQFWRWRDHSREERKAKAQLVGAINIVLSELAANRVILKRAVANQQTVGELRVSDDAYRQVELLLAERLPATAGLTVFQAYAPIRAGDLYQRWYPGSGIPGAGSLIAEPSHVQIDLAECERLLPVLERAGTLLRTVRDALGHEFRSSLPG
jgi:MFS family permease